MSTPGRAEIYSSWSRYDDSVYLLLPGNSKRLTLPKDHVYPERINGAFAKMAYSIAELARRSKLTGWRYDTRILSWVHDPDDKRSVELPDPCPESIANDVGWSFRVCARQIDRLGRCKMHANAKERREESSRVHREQMDKMRDQERRSQQMAQDLDEAWGMVCDHLDIDPERRGKVAVQGANRGVVDYEILMNLLRRTLDH